MQKEKIFNQVKFLTGADKIINLPDIKLPEIALWGRSNVGKSSTINWLFHRKDLARSSKTPGRTQQINLFIAGENQLVVADLPGYGYAKASKVITEKIHQLCYDYLHNRKIDCFFILIDARRGLMELDYEVIEALKALGHKFVFLITKVDLINQKEIELLCDSLSDYFYIMTSVKKQIGLKNLQQLIMEILK